jgi:hypothetical protein
MQGVHLKAILLSLSSGWRQPTTGGGMTKQCLRQNTNKGKDHMWQE